MVYVAYAETRTWVGSGEGRFNEDYAAIREDSGVAMLVDGATGLTKTNLVAGESDASWFSRELCEATLVLLGDSATETGDALAHAGRQVADAYLRMPGAQDLVREDYPNGSIAIIRWVHNELEVAMLGDCTAVVILRSGEPCVIHDPTLDKLDSQNYERMYRYAVENNATMAEARRALNDRFIHNRLKMNEPDGYWAADITCRGYGHELVCRFALSDVAGVFACSDGFAAAVAMGVVEDEEQLAHRVLAGEGTLVGRELRNAEKDDESCLRVHRSKPSDDATFVAMAFR